MLDIESQYYWIYNHLKMVLWLLLFAGALFGILWLAQRLGFNPAQRIGSFANNVEMARAAAAAGEHREAIAYLSQALQRDPTRPDLWLTRAENRLAIEDAKGALDDAAEAGRRGATAAATALLQARADLQLHTPLAAIAHLSGAIESDPAANDARQMRAQLYIEAGQMEPALNDLNELVKRQPENPTPRLTRAEICLMCGNFQIAANEFAHLAAGSSTQPEVWLGLGTALLGLGRHEEADASFDRALQGARSAKDIRAAAFLGRAVTLRQLGRHQDALDAWNFHSSLTRETTRSLKDIQIDHQFLLHLYFEVGGRPHPAKAAAP